MRHVERMRVHWHDTDASGLIHHTAAFRYFEMTENAMMRRLFPDGLPHGESFGFPRVHVEADYRVSLRFPDEFDCIVTIAAIGHTSVTWMYEVRDLQGRQCIVGRVVTVTTDASGASMPLPPGFRAGLERVLEPDRSRS